MRTLRRLLIAAAAPWLAACSSPSLTDYAGERPAFDLRGYFDGTVQAQGLVSDRAGKVLRRFTVTIDCRWQGDVGTLDERFVYSDGQRQQRIWTLVRGADGRYTGTAADVVGQAEGDSAGAAFRWRYTLRVPVDGRDWELEFDDWMYRIDERTVINRAVMSKWGVRVGEVTVAFQRPLSEMAANPPLRDWHGRVAWIVGASSGIGRASAARLHALGATVIVSARRSSALDEFTHNHPGSVAFALDATDRDAVRAVARRVQAEHGPIDLAMYCAGHYRPMRAEDCDADEMARHMAVNYTGATHLLDALLPILLAQGHGHLSLVASVAGYRGLPRAMAYGPSKAAVQHLAETLYLDLAPRGIGVSVINPGFVETRLTARNDFEMPAMITAEAAADEIVAGWARGRFDIHFPRRFTLRLKLLRLLPHALYVAAVRRSTGM